MSVSTPRRVTVHGIELETSIVKEPGVGPIHIGVGGPEGNRTAVHPEAVYAFAAEQYDYWARELNIDRGKWRFAHWGENITTAGIDESRLRIGDILTIGPSAILQVCSPRIPCLKLAWRLEQPESVLRQLTNSGLIGFYLRVLQSGPVSAGDVVTVRSPHPDNLTVAEVCRLIQDPTADPAALKRTLALPGLSDYPAGFLRHRLNQLEDAAFARRNRWAGWREFVVREVISEAQSIRSFELAPTDGGPIAGYRAGQFIACRIERPGLPDLLRTWSLSDFDVTRRSYRITIKRTHDGHASAWMHDVVVPGTRLQVKAPAGAFTLDRTSRFPPVLLSAGVGITPMIAMLKSYLAHTSDGGIPLTWVHCTRNSSTHAFRNETAALIARHPHVRRLIVYSRPHSTDRPGVDYDHAGHLTLEQLQAVLSPMRFSVAGRELEVPAQLCEFYLCGPAAWQETLRTTLTTWGVTEPHIRFESFSTGPVPPVGPIGAESSEVVFARSGITARWERDSEQSLLDLAEQCGLSPDHLCRAGNCYSCRCTLRDGAVVYATPPAGIDEKSVLICCARPASARVVIDL